MMRFSWFGEKTVSDDKFLPQLMSDLNDEPQSTTPKVQLIAKSPNTKAAREILKSLPSLGERGVEFEAIFKQIPKKGPGSAVLKRVAAVYGMESAHRSVRIADVKNSGEVFEQVNFGDVAVWTGKPLRSMVSAPFSTDRLEYAKDGGDTMDFAALSFNSLWSVSASVDAKAINFRDEEKAPALDRLDGPPANLKVS